MNVHLGPAAALVLTALGLVLAGCRPVTVSLTENSGRGQAVIQSYYIAEQSKSWAPGSGAADDQAEPIPQWYGQTQRWFQAPDRWRIETSGSAASGSNWSTISVSDGSSRYDYDVGADSVSINKAAAEVPSADAVGAGSLAQLFERMAACYRPTVTGSGEIAGQPVHVVDLGPTLCPSASMPEANGRELIWVDKNTFFVLKHEVYSTDGRTLLIRTEMTEVQYNPTLDPSLFTFAPPAGAQVVDYRPQPLPLGEVDTGTTPATLAAALDSALQPLAQQVNYPIFAPRTIPDGLAPRLPKLMPLGDNLQQLMIEFVPADAIDQDVAAGQVGLVITQQAADYASVVNFTQGATPVLLPAQAGQGEVANSDGTPLRAWARRGFINVDGTGSDSGVVILRDGVLISLNSFALSAEELLALAADLVPVPGNSAALPAPQPPSVAEVRSAAPFAFFVPTWLPAGLAAEPPVGYSITYHDRGGSPIFTLTNNAGVGDDSRHGGELVILASGVEAHWLGSLLWWVQEGTQLALSSTSLSKEEMLRIAASVSSSAEPAVVELPPQPPPAAALPMP